MTGRIYNSRSKKREAYPWLGGSVDWSVIPCTKKVVGSIPAQGTYLVWGFDPRVGCVWKVTDWYFFLTLMFPSLSPFLSKMNEHTLGWGLKNNNSGLKKKGVSISRVHKWLCFNMIKSKARQIKAQCKLNWILPNWVTSYVVPEKFIRLSFHQDYAFLEVRCSACLVHFCP